MSNIKRAAEEYGVPKFNMELNQANKEEDLAK